MFQSSWYYWCLLACGIPKGMDKKTYETGKDALTVVENYNKGLITKEVASDRIKSMANSLEKLELSDSEAKSKNGLLQSQLFLLSIVISTDGDIYGTVEEIKETLGLK